MARETPPRPVLLFACEGVDAGAWRAEIDALQTQVEVRFWPDAGDPREVTAGFAWGNPPGFWRRFPNLRAIFSLGAGVDTLLADRDLPTSAQVVRMLDDSMASDMSDFVRMCVTYHHRAMHEYAVLQAEGVWRSIRPPRNARRTVGVMGLGALGGRCALDLAAAGFAVRGWARRSRTLPDIATFTGEVEFAAFLAATEILVCLLPLTPETEDILSARVFSALPRGACVINVGRGRQLVDDDRWRRWTAGISPPRPWTFSGSSRYRPTIRSGVIPGSQSCRMPPRSPTPTPRSRPSRPISSGCWTVRRWPGSWTARPGTEPPAAVGDSQSPN